MDSWRKVWREGFQPQLSDEQLARLRERIDEDSPRLIQGCTTSPPPLQCVFDWPWEGGDAIVNAFGDGTVGEAEEFFAMLCFNADQRVGEPAGCRWFLCWYDETPRDEMRRELKWEIDRELSRRSGLIAVTQ